MPHDAVVEVQLFPVMDKNERRDNLKYLMEASADQAVKEALKMFVMYYPNTQIEKIEVRYLSHYLLHPTP